LVLELSAGWANPSSCSLWDGHALLFIHEETETLTSPCGLEQGLEELYGRYKDQGLVVMGFPSNQFGNQEPEDEAAISTFVVDTFGVSFPMFSKVTCRAR
jgi:glutathione peroxidase